MVDGVVMVYFSGFIFGYGGAVRSVYSLGFFVM